MAPSFFVFVTSILTFSFSSVVAVDFNYNSFPTSSIRDFNLNGDAYIFNEKITLTSEFTDSPSSGSLVYREGFRCPCYFRTFFGFTLNSVNSISNGNGFTFFISPNPQIVGEAGCYLGISSRTGKNQFLAVEFDGRMDTEFDDPDSNHVGIDLGSLVSYSKVKLGDCGISLHAGQRLWSWIEYDHGVMDVFLNYTKAKPTVPILKTGINISYLDGLVFAGFSGSRDSNSEPPLIEMWEFAGAFVGDEELPPSPKPWVADRVDERSHRTGKTKFRIVMVCVFFFVILLICVVWIFVFVKKSNSISMKKFWTFLEKFMILDTLKESVRLKIKTPREYQYQELIQLIQYSPKWSMEFAVIVDNDRFNLNVQRVLELRHFIQKYSEIKALHHENLAAIRGWTSRSGELSVIYDFTGCLPLDQLLYEGSGLDWHHRYWTLIKLVGVLTFLHERWKQIHGNIRTSNIMLDRRFNMRIGNFKMSSLVDDYNNHHSITTAGTGYTAPEYFGNGKATSMTDVYSLGIVILETVCGRKPIQCHGHGMKKISLVEWVRRLDFEGKILESVDMKLKGQFNEQDMKKLLFIGLRCAHPNSTERPPMTLVSKMLDEEANPRSKPGEKPLRPSIRAFTVDDDERALIQHS